MCPHPYIVRLNVCFIYYCVDFDLEKRHLTCENGSFKDYCKKKTKQRIKLSETMVNYFITLSFYRTMRFYFPQTQKLKILKIIFVFIVIITIIHFCVYLNINKIIKKTHKFEIKIKNIIYWKIY